MSRLQAVDVHLDLHYEPCDYGDDGGGVTLSESAGAAFVGQGILGDVFARLRGIRPRDFADAFADPDLGLASTILEMRAQGVPWELIITLIISLITEFLKRRQPQPS